MTFVPCVEGSNGLDGGTALAEEQHLEADKRDSKER